MIVLGVWIKFFVSWKRELDLTYDIDNAIMNNGIPDEMNVDNNEPCRDISGEGDKKELTTEDTSKNADCAKTPHCVKPEWENKAYYINDVNVIELKHL